MVVALFLLYILLVAVGLIPRSIFPLKQCMDRGGRCSPQGGCTEDEYQLFGVGSCQEGEICCKLYEEKTLAGLEKFNAAAREALLNAIIVTLNKDTTPLADRSTVNLRVDNEYTFHLQINDKLLKDEQIKPELGPCAVYLVDAKDKGKKYVFSNEDGKLIPTDVPVDLIRGEIAECDAAVFKSKTFKPSLLDAYKDLTMYVILFDKEVGDQFKINAGFAAASALGGASNPEAYSKLVEMYSNTQHWLAMRVYRLQIDPLVKISGVSGEWVAKDQITITCNGVKCKRIMLKLAKLDKDQTYKDLLDQCQKDENYMGTLDYISGTMTKTTGIPLNIDLGGFRLPSQQKIMYITDKKPIAVIQQNKADVTIDKATMLRTFYIEGKTDFYVGESTYLCAKAVLEDDTSVYSVSNTPLKVDAIPPYIDPDKDIKVIYPDPITATSINTPYYYRQYPRVVITQCYDFGQSGCVNYDYYIHTGNFVNLQSHSADWQTGVVGLVLTEGLNMLLSYFAEKDAANTICPFITSSGYLRNTNQEIRFRSQGQGIICLRVSDKAGNTELYWKPLWTPEEMFKRILANQTEELLSSTSTNPLT